VSSGFVGAAAERGYAAVGDWLPGRTWGLWIVVGVLSASLLVQHSQEVLYVAMVALVTIVPVARFAKHRDPFELLHVLSLGFVYYYVAGGTYMEIFGTSTGAPFDGTLVYASVILGYTAFCVGYFSDVGVRLGARMPRFDGTGHPARLAWSAAAVLALALIATVGGRGLSNSQTGHLAGIFAKTTGLAAVFLLVRHFLVRTRGSYLLAVVGIFLSFAHTVLVVGTERRDIIRTVLMLIVARHYGSRRFRVRSLVLIGLVGLLGIWGLKVQQQFYRYSVSEWSVALFRAVAAGQSHYYGGMRVAVARSFDVLQGTENFASIANQIESGALDRLWGQSYVRILFAPIPRSVWEDKPQQLGRLTGAVSGGAWLGGAQPVTLLGEMYWNYGFLGIALFMLLLGIGSRGAYEWLCRHAGGGAMAAAAVVYAVLAAMLLQSMRTGSYLLLLSYGIAYLPLAVGSIWLTWRGDGNRSTADAGPTPSPEE
jgi:hypothetical protein